MAGPLVSVICVCFNQARFVREAIHSVLAQTYSPVELIVVDDASADSSTSVIKETVNDHSAIKFLPLQKNSGICAAFNRGLEISSGEYVIDFAADDIMFPERIEKQVEFFKSLDNTYGVIFTDAVYVDEQGKFLRNHFDYLFRKKLLTEVPRGDVFRDVLFRYFIPSPSMMVKKNVFDVLQGYDENLSYEDFDFWVRSSRFFKYGFLNERLTKIRKREGSMSTGWYKQGDRQLESTYMVCRKALKLCQSPEDQSALAKRLKFELRQSVFSGNRNEAVLFYSLLEEIGQAGRKEKILRRINKMNLPLSFLRAWYQRLRFG